MIHFLEATAPAGGSMGSSIIMIVAMLGIFYFMLIRPENKRKKEAEQTRNSVKTGDEITTIGGIVGRVVAIKDEEDALIIETGSDRVKMKFKKWCISSVDTVKETTKAEPERKGLFSGFGKKKKDEDYAPATDKKPKV